MEGRQSQAEGLQKGFLIEHKGINGVVTKHFGKARPTRRWKH